MDPTAAAAQGIAEHGYPYLLAASTIALSGVIAWLARQLLAAKDQIAELRKEHGDRVESLYKERREDDMRRLDADAQILKALDMLTEAVGRHESRRP